MHERVNEHVVLTDKHDISLNNPLSDKRYWKQASTGLRDRGGRDVVPNRDGGLGNKGVRWSET